MKMRLTLISLFVLMALGTQPLFAQTDNDKGEVINDDIVLFGENLNIEADSTVNGDVVIFGGNATIAGSINGDLVVFGGHVELESAVSGDLFVLGGDVVGLEGASTGGECLLMGGVTSGDFGCTAVSGEPDFLADLDVFDEFVGDNFDETITVDDGGVYIDDSPSFAGTLFGSLFFAVFAALIAYGVASAVPQHLQRAEDVVRQKSIVSGVVGGLTAVSIPAILSIGFVISSVLILACGIGLLGYPVLLALGLLFGAGSVFGWVVLGRLGAERLGVMQHRSLAMQTAVGTLLLTFIVNAFDIVPVVGDLLSMAVLSVGLGATVLTRFGTRSYGLPQGHVVEDSILIDSDKQDKVMDTLFDDSHNFK